MLFMLLVLKVKKIKFIVNIFFKIKFKVNILFKINLTIPTISERKIQINNVTTFEVFLRQPNRTYLVSESK
jgi:hypothetical protein